jgi:hypothetical protein
VLDPLKRITHVTLIHTPSSSTYPEKTLFLFPTQNREDQLGEKRGKMSSWVSEKKRAGEKM